VGEAGLVSVHRTPPTSSEPAVMLADSETELPSKVLLGRVRAAQGGHDGPNLTSNQEDTLEIISNQDSTNKLINHDMKPRIYFLPS
jgi:hypothetical protein